MIACSSGSIAWTQFFVGISIGTTCILVDLIHTHTCIEPSHSTVALTDCTPEVDKEGKDTPWRNGEKEMSVGK